MFYVFEIQKKDKFYPKINFFKKNSTKIYLNTTNFDWCINRFHIACISVSLLFRLLSDFLPISLLITHTHTHTSISYCVEPFLALANTNLLLQQFRFWSRGWEIHGIRTQMPRQYDEYAEWTMRFCASVLA